MKTIDFNNLGWYDIGMITLSLEHRVRYHEAIGLGAYAGELRELVKKAESKKQEFDRLRHPVSLQNLNRYEIGMIAVSVQMRLEYQKDQGRPIGLLQDIVERAARLESELILANSQL